MISRHLHHYEEFINLTSQKAD